MMKPRRPRTVRPPGAPALAIVALLLSGTGATAREPQTTVAFLGDQGAGEAARAVLDLVRAEEADLLVLLGDFGYDREAAADWIQNTERTFGPDFPVLGVVGNHERHEWPIYRNWLVRRAARVPELRCTGDPGVKARCSFRGISVLQVAPGVREVRGVASEDDYAGYLRRELADDPNRWRICSWHKNQHDMQIGAKRDETGWDVYEACREGGGFVATAHEHSYSRTYLMDDFENRSVVHRGDHLQIQPGRSFAFVSGLGGRGAREQKNGGDWWASTYSATQGATHGALFCTFGQSTASCRFVDVAGGVQDTFTLESGNVSGGATRREDEGAVDGWSKIVPESRHPFDTLGPWAALAVLALVAIRRPSRALFRRRRAGCPSP